MRGHLGHSPHRVLEYLRTFLVNVVHALLDRFLAGGMQRAAPGHVQKRSTGAIHVVLEIEDPFVGACRFEQRGSRAIAEQHAGCAIRVVQNGSHGIAADDQHFLMRSGGDELRADGERVGEARARRGKIKTPSLFRANALLDQAGGWREKNMSGVTLASTIRSISVGSVLVCASTALAASVAMCEVAMPSRRCDVHGCRCACGSIRRWSRRFSRGPRWSSPWAERSRLHP